VATHETFGLVLLEAAAARVPALALAVGGVPEVLAATPEALLPPALEAVGLAQQLHSWLSTPARRQALADRQAASAEARFDMGRLVADTLAFYRYARRHLYHRQRPLAAPLGRKRGVAAATPG
jgi:glycosyltransferase involved in cell wall biosynthesis